MPEVSIKDQLQKLIEMQKIDEEIYNFKKDIKERPLIIAKLQEEFEETKSELKRLEEKFKGVQLSRKESELELKEKENTVAKFNTQLSEIKTNKEYLAKITEIEHLKADKSVVEEKILISYDESDAVAQEVEKEKVLVGEKEKEFLAKKKEIDEEVKVKQERINVLDSQRQQALPEIDKNYLARYERILENKEGLAIVPVQGSVCGGCFMNMNPQKINALKMNDQIVECEMCSRILYLEDDK